MKNLTCIVGLVDKGNVYIGGDSAAVGGYSISVRKDKKVFHNGPFIMGFTCSFRMGQLLQYKLVVEEQTSSYSDLEFMSTVFIDTVRACFSDNGFKFDSGFENSGGAFIVGYRSNLYIIDVDYQVGLVDTPYYSVGCGSDIALGAMYVSKGAPESRIKQALEAASKFSAGVSPPFHIVKQINKKPIGKRKS